MTLLAPLVAPILGSVQLAEPKLPPLNAALVTFCEARLGQKVGSGQCADLPARALRSLKAMPRVGDAPNPGDYVWGRRIATLRPGNADAAKILPGDVVQYRDVVFEHREASRWSKSSASHHTSVVAVVAPRTLTVYEQNVNGRMTVGRTDLVLTDLKAGTLWVYRPQNVASR